MNDRRARRALPCIFVGLLWACSSTSGTPAVSDAGVGDATAPAADPSDGSSEATTQGHDAQADGPPVCTGDWGFSSGACTTCLTTSCCAEGDACLKLTDCPNLFKCLHACDTTDGTCLMGCLNRYPQGIPASSKLDGCIFMKCPAACQD
jgi:hypothetical protein